MNEIIKNNIVDFDIDLTESKGLCVNNLLNDRYCELYKNYKALLEEYLLIKLSLKEYDDRLSNSELSFVQLSVGDMDFYQFISTMGLNYIYLRNRLSIEKLSLEDINILVNLSNEELNNPSEELFQLIEKTYRNVIDSRVNTDINRLCCYGIDRDEFWIDSTELVFGVRYNKYFNEGTKTDKEWAYNYFRQTDYLNSLLQEMSDNCSKILGFKVNFIQYDDFTIVNSRMK